MPSCCLFIFLSFYVSLFLTSPRTQVPGNQENQGTRGRGNEHPGREGYILNFEQRKIWYKQYVNAPKGLCGYRHRLQCFLLRFERPMLPKNAKNPRPLTRGREESSKSDPNRCKLNKRYLHPPPLPVCQTPETLEV